VDDIDKARNIISSLFDYSEETMLSRKEQLRLSGINPEIIDFVYDVQYPPLDKLIGGFDENFCFLQMAFFNCNYNTSDFLNQSLLLFKDAASQFNKTTKTSLVNILKDQFLADKIRQNPLSDVFAEALK
jgi:hypothetical protein